MNLKIYYKASEKCGQIWIYFWFYITLCYINVLKRHFHKCNQNKLFYNNCYTTSEYRITNISFGQEKGRKQKFKTSVKIKHYILLKITYGLFPLNRIVKGKDLLSGSSTYPNCFVCSF